MAATSEKTVGYEIRIKVCARDDGGKPVFERDVPNFVQVLRTGGGYSWGTITDGGDYSPSNPEPDEVRIGVTVAFYDPKDDMNKEKTVFIREGNTIFYEQVPKSEWNPPEEDAVASCDRRKMADGQLMGGHQVNLRRY